MFIISQNITFDDDVHFWAVNGGHGYTPQPAIETLDRPGYSGQNGHGSSNGKMVWGWFSGPGYSILQQQIVSGYRCCMYEMYAKHEKIWMGIHVDMHGLHGSWTWRFVDMYGHVVWIFRFYKASSYSTNLGYTVSRVNEISERSSGIAARRVCFFRQQLHLLYRFLWCQKECGPWTLEVRLGCLRNLDTFE